MKLHFSDIEINSYWLFSDTFENGQYILLNFTMSESEIVGRVEWNRYPEKLILGMVVVMGVQSPVNSVLVNNSPQSFSYHTINKVSNLLCFVCYKVYTHKYTYLYIYHQCQEYQTIFHGVTSVIYPIFYLLFHSL